MDSQILVRLLDGKCNRTVEGLSGIVGTILAEFEASLEVTVSAIPPFQLCLLHMAAYYAIVRIVGVGAKQKP